MSMPPAIGLPALTVGDLTRTAVSRFPDRIAVKLRDGSDSRTYGELDARTSRLARGLLGAGLVPGDRIATWMEDCLEYVEVYLAAAKAGLAIAPINARFLAGEASHILSDSGARMLVWTSGLDEQVSRLREQSDELLAVRVGSGARAELLKHECEYEELFTSAGNGPLPAVEPESLYILGYTSGTTGRPKGAMLTHRTVLAAARMNAYSLRLTGHTVHALTGSMSFVAVVPAHIVCVLAVGGTIIMMGKWDVDTLVDVIERERATFTYVPSPMLKDFARVAAERPHALDSLNSIVHSASRGNPAAVAAVLHEIGAARYVEGWGMTEHSGAVVTATVPEDYANRGAGRDMIRSVGRATVGAAVRLIDPESLEELRWDGETVGELVISSPAVMAGYWNRPDATTAVMLDGWYRTGDLGTIDPDGFVEIAERRNDLIVSGGMNVYPSEVEGCIISIDGIREVAVVGVPHERWGQSVLAAIVLEPGASVTSEEVIAVCRANLASFKKPSRVVVLDALPKTTSLKIARAVLRDQMTELVLSGPAVE
jgi:acyl-CoA synthetase (AMP-forming)/AMP-acid ligase II